MILFDERYVIKGTTLSIVKRKFKTRMHSSRMRTARLRIVRGGEGGVVSWSGGGGRCCDLVLGGGGRCCVLVLGGRRCCDLVAHLPPPHPELNRMSDTRL